MTADHGPVLGPAALWFYVRHGRRTSRPVIEREGEPDPEKLPTRITSTKAISHSGAGCVLGDIGVERLVRATGMTIAGKSGPGQGLWAAIKADTFTILAFQVGLFSGTRRYQEAPFAPRLAKTTASYWLLMQLAMIVDFFTAWPVNDWLVRVGRKERM